MDMQALHAQELPMLTLSMTSTQASPSDGSNTPTNSVGLGPLQGFTDLRFGPLRRTDFLSKDHMVHESLNLDIVELLVEPV